MRSAALARLSTVTVPLRRIIVGVDASAESQAALRWAIHLAVALQAGLTVVHGVGLLEEGGYRPHVDVETMLADTEPRPRPPAVDVDVVTEDGPAADVIVRIADRQHADLIVVGSRGLGASPRLLGSVSEAVLSRARIPVLIVPAP